MARFSLSPPPRASPSSTTAGGDAAAVAKTPPEWKWTFPPQDQYAENEPYQSYQRNSYRYDESDSSAVSSSSEEGESDSDEETNKINVSDEEDEEEEEPPHPLGFTPQNQRYGKTRFGPTSWQAMPPRKNTQKQFKSSIGRCKSQFAKAILCWLKNFASDAKPTGTATRYP